MGGFLAKLFKLAIWGIILAIIAGICFILFINPNNYKNQITQAVRNYTGQPFQLNGSIQWSIRPQTLVNLQDVALGKAPDDKTPFLKIKEVIMHLDLLSVLKGNVVVNDLTLNNVTLDWATGKTFVANAKNGRPFLIQALQLKNANVTIQDQSDHLNWLLQNASVSATSLMVNGSQELPAIQIQGALVNVDHNAIYNIDSTIKLDTTKHAITLDPLKVTWNDTPLHGTALVAQYDADPVISGNMAMDTVDVGAVLKKIDPYFANNNIQINHNMQMQMDYSYATKDQILDLTKIHLQLDKGVLNGNFKLGTAKPYHAEFVLTADNLDLAPLGLIGSALYPSVHTMTAVPADLIKDLIISGKFSGTKLSFNPDLLIDQLHMEVAGQGGIVQFTPVIISAYGGTHNITLSVDVINKQQPYFELNEQADKVALDPWLKLVNAANAINGTASIKASLQAMGSDLATLKQTVTGGINLYVNDGIYYGLDAIKLMRFTTETVTDIFDALSKSPAANLNVLAVKLSSDWIKTQQDQPKTKFDHFEFNADIDTGKSKKASIAMSNNIIDLKGTGEFNLSDATVNFKTTIVDLEDPNTNIKVLAGYMKQTPISMSITGTINKPTFGPNIQNYVSTVLKATQNDLFNQAISKMVSVTPPNAKTDKTATDLFLDSLQSLNK